MLVLAARNAAGLQAVAAECNALGARTLIMPTDVTDPVQCRHLVDTTAQQFGSLDIDRDARRVSVKGRVCDLTSYQFDLLVALAERAGRVLTRDQIMEAVRGRELEAFDRSIDVHMGRIRAAIEADPKAPRRILTVRGVGYVFAKQQD